MEILNRREEKLYQELKTRVEKEGVMTILKKDFPIWNTLLRKIDDSGYITVKWGEVSAFIFKNTSNFKQFDIEQKELKQSARRLSYHDYKVAIIAAIIGAAVGSLLTILWI